MAQQFQQSKVYTGLYKITPTPYFPNIYDAFKVLFIDLFVQLGDLASDFAQGYFLILDEELFYYGICTFAIHWVPGIVASIHCISTKRAEYGVSKTLAWAGEKTF